MKQSISISIPAYNNDTTIENLVLKCVDLIQKITDDWEILIINDGSTDSTKEKLEHLSKVSHRIRIYHHSENKGFGITLKEIFTFPKKEWMFFIPGDAQFPPEILSKMLPYTTKYDFIIGWRRKRSDGFHRKLNSYIYNLLISIISGKRVRDVNSSVMLKSEIAKNIPLKCRSAFIHAELYLKALSEGYKITEVEIEHKHRTSGKGAGNKLTVIIPTIRDLISFLLGRKTCYGL